ncbi:hypothetical protein [Indioceanicola profundi]|uniref:hypothetical protein n=1 Tax=Indioceanicola profundi TaxID=2220096 RepID=UPI000E6AAFD1|nr:hypothetical protein [Indioceanicola profundi]
MSMKIRAADGRLYTLGAALVTTLGVPAAVAATVADAPSPAEQVQQAPETAATDLLAGGFQYIPV